MFKFLTWRRPKRGSALHGVNHDRVETRDTNPTVFGIAPATEHQLILLVLSQIRKQHGIPNEWLIYDGVVVKTKNGKESRRIQIDINHWDGKLVLYLPALEQKLLTGLVNFNPVSDSSKYCVSWVFSNKVEYPHIDIPKNAWRANPTTPPAPSPSIDTSRSAANESVPPVTPLRVARDGAKEAWADTDTLH